MFSPTSRHPSFVAVLLAATVGRSPAIDELLDDLTEDYERRCATHGHARARWWYARQVLGSLPYVAETAARAATWNGFGTVVVNAITALTLLITSELMLGGIIGGILEMSGLLHESPLTKPGSGSWFLWILPLTTAGFALFGFLAAWLDPDRPLRTPAFGAVASFAWTLFALSRLPGMRLEVIALYAIWHALSVLAGGALRLRQSLRLARAAS